MLSGASMWRVRVLLVCGGLCWVVTAYASGLPTQVQLGGAIVAAVEDDAEQEELQNTTHFSEGTIDFTNWERVLKKLDEGRGKFHRRKQRKILKYLYPLLVGVLIAKTVLIPLILKMLTALSTTSFVMSKIALVTAGFLALKWIFAGYGAGDDGPKERTHLEIVHLPSPAFKAYHGAPGVWDDLSLSSSNVVDVFKARKQRHKYIPVGGLKDDFATTSGSGASNTNAAYHRYQPQHNYYSTYNAGQPFL